MSALSSLLVQNLVKVSLHVTQDDVTKVHIGFIPLAVLLDGALEADIQVVAPNAIKEPHNAAADDDGALTYILVMIEGVVTVGTGVGAQDEGNYENPSAIAFTDEKGFGHSSLVGQDGCTRLFIKRRGHLMVADFVEVDA